MTIEEVKKDLIIECSEDEVGLWVVLWYVHNYVKIDDPEERRQITLKIVYDLLKEELIQAIDPYQRDPYEMWSLSPEETIARIEREWDALGREPNIAEIVEFITTEKGDEVAKKLLENK
jgi:hypothetical protein